MRELHNQTSLSSHEYINAAVKREFIRRLTAMGYEHVPADSDNPERVLNDGREIVKFNENNDMLYKSENREIVYKLSDMRKEIREYVTAYITAKAAGADHNQDYYIILDFNRHVLAARESMDGSYMFVTWGKDYSGNGYEIGHYFTDFIEAKEDFARRAGLIDENKLFTETELTVIRSGLSNFFDVDMGSQWSFNKIGAIENVIEKINEIIVPQITEQQKQLEAEGEDYEPE